MEQQPRFLAVRSVWGRGRPNAGGETLHVFVRLFCPAGSLVGQRSHQVFDVLDVAHGQEAHIARIGLAMVARPPILGKDQVSRAVAALLAVQTGQGRGLERSHVDAEQAAFQQNGSLGGEQIDRAFCARTAQ